MKIDDVSLITVDTGLSTLITNGNHTKPSQNNLKKNKFFKTYSRTGITNTEVKEVKKKSNFSIFDDISSTSDSNSESPPKKTLNEPITNKETLKNSSKPIKSIDTKSKKDAKKYQHKETLSEAKTKSKEPNKLSAKKTSIARKSDKNDPKNTTLKLPERKAKMVKVKYTAPDSDDSFRPSPTKL